MHALSVSLLRAKQLPVITNGLGASPHAGSTCTIGVVTVRPLNRLPARLYFKLKPDPNNTFFFIFTCTTQYPWVLANLNLSQAMAPSKKKRIHTVFRDSSAHRSASTSKPRFVGEKVRVSDAFDLRMGKTPSRKNPAYWRDGGHDWVSIADLGSFGKYVGVTKERINDLAISESGIKPAPANTVLMSFKLSLGKTSITTEPVYTNEAIMAFVDKGVYPVDASFMYHQCRAKDWTAGTNTAVMGKTLNKKTLGQAYVHLPALEVQKMIAARLDFIDEQIRASKSSADKLEHLVKSRFVEMFSGVDQTRPLEKLIVPKTRISYGIVQPGPEGTGDMGILRPVDIVDGRLCLKGIKRIDRKIGDSYRRTELTGNEILTVVRGATGQTVRSEANCIGMNVTRGIAVIRYDPSLIDPDYLVSYMNSDDGQRYIADHTQGATLQQINIADLKAMPIPAPSLKSQQRFAAFAAQVDKSRFATHCDHPRASY